MHSRHQLDSALKLKQDLDRLKMTEPFLNATKRKELASLRLRWNYLDPDLKHAIEKQLHLNFLEQNLL